MLGLKPFEDPLGGVPLLRRRCQIRRQNRVDDWDQGA